MLSKQSCANVCALHVQGGVCLALRVHTDIEEDATWLCWLQHSAQVTSAVRLQDFESKLCQQRRGHATANLPFDDYFMKSRIWWPDFPSLAP